MVRLVFKNIFDSFKPELDCDLARAGFHKKYEWLPGQNLLAFKKNKNS